MKIIYVLLFVLILLINKCDAKPPIFLDNFNDAKVVSKDLKQPIILLLSADWCQYCNKLKKEITKPRSFFVSVWKGKVHSCQTLDSFQILILSTMFRLVSLIIPNGFLQLKPKPLPCPLQYPSCESLFLSNDYFTFGAEIIPCEIFF